MVFRYWELIPMESGSELLAPQDTATVRVAKEIPAANKQRASWSMEENWPRLNNYF